MKYDPLHTFVTSDHHFGLWKVNTTPWHPPVFSESGDKEAIAKWNSVVKPTDLVLYVGDFCDSGETDLREYRIHLFMEIMNMTEPRLPSIWEPILK